MTRFLIAAIALTTISFAGSAPTRAADACAGQSWPNLSSACTEQRTKQLSATMTVKTKPAKAQVNTNNVKAQTR